ncbi:DNA-repair protein XRCC1 [Silene latifolia]|uniref:DNA-repair protein XRCC1 n=1 Tax=Silene latifolia TaxID=37657 RepID=UPI003D76E421
MSASKGSANDRAGKAPKRALPSWMSARDDKDGNEPSTGDDSHVENVHKKMREQGKEVKDIGEGSGGKKKASSAGPSSFNFSKLLDGVVFALSGFVNPERGNLRSQALEMGAEYKQDWNPDCTLLVCAFPNTPKFRQVEADGGTIVSKDWIKECYTQKKLVDIETYLMHIGKPWRKSSVSLEENQACETPQPNISHKHEVKRSGRQSNAPSSAKEMSIEKAKGLKEKFSPSKVKKWAMDDLNKTLAWLESQEEKPEPCEIRNVAAEGILTCLQDAVDLLDQDKDLQLLTEQWNMVPQVVDEIIKVQAIGTSTSNEDLHKQALTCKKIYEEKYRDLSDGSISEEPKPSRLDKGKDKLNTVSESRDYDSDETVEMTEDEINDAYNSVASSVPKF